MQLDNEDKGARTTAFVRAWLRLKAGMRAVWAFLLQDDDNDHGDDLPPRMII